MFEMSMDEALLEEVTYLVEDPTPLCGTFEERFLALPRELLVVTMRTHQRYFTVEGLDGKLLNKFITVANTRPEDPEVVGAQGTSGFFLGSYGDLNFHLFAELHFPDRPILRHFVRQWD